MTIMILLIVIGRKDFDMDGLSTFDEVFIYHSNPFSSDTDGDGLDDHYEVEIGTLVNFNWQYSYSLEAFKSGLSKVEREKVSFLQFEGSDFDKVIQIAEWVGKNIQYDYEREKLVMGRDLNTRKVKPPIETIKDGKGICTDYTILTAAILLNNGFDEVYIVNVFKDSFVGHTAVGVSINNTILVIDQGPPLITLNAYRQLYKDSKVQVVKIGLDNKGEVVVEKVWMLD